MLLNNLLRKRNALPLLIIIVGRYTKTQNPSVVQPESISRGFKRSGVHMEGGLSLDRYFFYINMYKINIIFLFNPSH